jgi:H+/Cl- antiporter ClcA
MDLSKNTMDLCREGTAKLGQIKRYFLKLLPFWIAGSLTAVVATSYAKIFSLFEAYSIQLYEHLGELFILIPPSCFLLSWFLVHALAPRANGSGIPQLMASIELTQSKNEGQVNDLLSLRIIVVKVLSSLIGVLGGGSIGREGPTLQISGSIFSMFNRYWKFSEIQNKAAFIMAGAASGLASAFNTPLGGIVYVVEELAKSHLSTFRIGLLHAVIFSGIISQMIMGPYLYLGFPKVADFSGGFLFQYILIASVSALVIIAFSHLLKVLVKTRSRFNSLHSNILFALVAGLIFGFYVVFISKTMLGPGKDIINRLLFDRESANFVDVMSRFWGSILTYANGGAGGIFAPTLSIGGASGSFIDGLFSFKVGTLSVLIGMTAGLSALTQSPLTSFILILEMTDRHRAIFPLMLASIVGHGLSKLIVRTSFYEFVCQSILEEYNVKRSDET